MNPRISVIMGVYNDEKNVGRAIKSILNQTYRNFEFIIINDGSTDKTQEVIGSFDDERIINVINKKNMKFTWCLNYGLDIARGEFIATQDSDDISMPTRLEEEIKVFENSSPNVALVASFCRKIRDSGEIVSLAAPTEFDLIKKKLIIKNLFHHNCLYKKTVVINLGKYKKNYLYAQDYDLWFRLIREGYEFRITPKELLLINKSRSEERRQTYEMIKTRLVALYYLDYPFYYSIYLIRPLIDLLLPNFIKRPIQHHILRSR